MLIFPLIFPIHLILCNLILIRKEKARYHHFIVLKAPPSNLPRIKQQSVPIYGTRTSVVLCSGFIIKIGGIYRTRKKTNVSLQSNMSCTASNTRQIYRL